jgi:hypothetical protein
MVALWCDRKTCVHCSSTGRVCEAEEVTLETQFNGDSACLTFEKKEISK